MMSITIHTRQSEIARSKAVALKITGIQENLHRGHRNAPGGESWVCTRKSFLINNQRHIFVPLG